MNLDLITFDFSTLTAEQATLALTAYGLLLLFFWLFLLLFVGVALLALREGKRLNGLLAQRLATLPADKLGTVTAVYQCRRKSLGLALLLSLGFGQFGFQNLYLGRKKAFVLSILFFWTGIPAIVSLFNALNMPKTVAKDNLKALDEVLDMVIPKVELPVIGVTRER